MDPAQIPIRATTQEHLPIEDIRDDLVILKDGSCAMILSVSSVNFDLLSEMEQEAIIYAYGALLNSLTFAIQIVIRSHRKDISSYLEVLERRETVMKDSPLLAKMINSYRHFVAEMVKKNNVLDKKFYVAIPFSSLELGVSSTLTSIFNFKKANALPFEKSYIISKAKNALGPKRDHLVKLFARLGLAAKQMETEELVKFYYSVYNQEWTGETEEQIERQMSEKKNLVEQKQ